MTNLGTQVRLQLPCPKFAFRITSVPIDSSLTLLWLWDGHSGGVVLSETIVWFSSELGERLAVGPRSESCLWLCNLQRGPSGLSCNWNVPRRWAANLKLTSGALSLPLQWLTSEELAFPESQCGLAHWRVGDESGASLCSRVVHLKIQYALVSPRDFVKVQILFPPPSLKSSLRDFCGIRSAQAYIIHWCFLHDLI